MSGCSESSMPDNLLDNPQLYEKTGELDFYELELSILPPEHNYLADGLFTWEELNTLDGRYGGSDIEVSGLVKEVRNGSSQNGLLGYGLVDANCQIEQRGQSARLYDEKSYEINLVKSAGLFYGHEILNLNKHAADNTRVLNKLCFDLFQMTDDLLSLDTNFIHLQVQDLNEKTPEFVDYGLFTQVEEVDEFYFKKRDLDPEGYLYKAINFEFQRYSDVLMLKTDPDYNEKDFEDILAIDGLDDHTYLIEMLSALNNPFISINQVIDKYFHRDNYLTWLASNILLGNVDSASGNFYLYSKSDENRWYFIPWDYDKSLTAYSSSLEWHQGVSTYWGSEIHREFLKNDINREDLASKVDELYETVYNEENITMLLERYSPVIEQFVTPYPREIDMIVPTIAQNKKKFEMSLEKPMPFFIGGVVDYDHDFSINWSEAYDFQNQKLTYELWLSDSADFSEIIVHEENIQGTELIVDALKPGIYYMKMRVKDEDGNEQSSFDYYIDQVTKLYYPGVKSFIVQ